MIEKEWPDVLSLFPRFYDLSVSRNPLSGSKIVKLVIFMLLIFFKCEIDILRSLGLARSLFKGQNPPIWSSRNRGVKFILELNSYYSSLRQSLVINLVINKFKGQLIRNLRSQSSTSRDCQLFLKHFFIQYKMLLIFTLFIISEKIRARNLDLETDCKEIVCEMVGKVKIK